MQFKERVLLFRALFHLYLVKQRLNMREKSIHTIALLPISFSKFFERVGYYGIRSFFVLYLVNGVLGFSREEASSIYGSFTLATGLMPLLGGLLTDLLLGVRLASIIGLFLQFIACILMMIPNTGGFYAGLFCMAFGIGLYNPSIISSLYFSYRDRQKGLDAAMNIFYVVINIGAFSAPLIIGTFAEDMGYISGFGLGAAMFLISALILIFSKKATNELPARATIHLDEPSRSTMKVEWRIVTIAFIFIMLPLFWAMFELGSAKIYGRLYEPGSDGFGSYMNIIQMVNPVVMLIAGILLSIIWSFWNLSSLLKIMIGFMILILSWVFLMLTIKMSISNEFVVFVILAFVLQAVAELFISPISLTYLCKHGSDVFNSTLVGLHLSVSRLATFVISFISVFTISARGVYLFLIVGSFLLALILLIFFFLADHKKQSRES